MACKVIAMAYVEMWFGEFQKGNLYAFATRPGLGKTHFALTLSGHWAKKGRKTLYISDAMNAETFEQRLDRLEPYYHDLITFKESYTLTLDKLSAWMDADSFDLLILDPYDVYCWDIDVGALKELAKSKNVCVWVTKQLTLFDDVPSLAHIRFPSERMLDRFIAYTDLILLGYSKGETVGLRAGKNIAGTLGEELEMYKVMRSPKAEEAQPTQPEESVEEMIEASEEEYDPDGALE